MHLVKKIANTFLALLLIAATTGFTLHKHYCLGQLKQVSVFEEAESCMSKMDKEEESCPMDCCDTTSEQYQVNELQKVSFEHNFAPDLKLVALVSYLLSEEATLSAETVYATSHLYKPPLIDRDITISVQSFLL